MLHKLADKNACIILVGNKIDLEDQRKISRQNAENVASQYQIEYFEVSTKQENSKVTPIFESLIMQMYRKRLGIQPREPEQRPDVK